VKITAEIEGYIASREGEFLELLKTLAKIPAPSNHEEKRAAFIKDWLRKNGAQGVYIDGALNVVYPVNLGAENRLRVFMAHTDVVFPDTEELPLRVSGGKIFAPGVGDDTANLVALLFAAKFIAEKGLTPAEGRGVLLVANSGEEGLGNLRGARKICGDFGGRIDEFVSFDGVYSHMTCSAVGSRRFKITLRAEGGHSWGNFGNKSAVLELAELIVSLRDIKLPRKGKTTWNCGVISGGASVNTIAQSAEMLYEFRSDRGENLLLMQERLEDALDACRDRGVRVDCVLAGERPCASGVDSLGQRRLTERCRGAVRDWAGVDAQLEAASTDSNVPLSLGIPAVTLGCYAGGGAHTREEWVDTESLKAGYRIAFDVILDSF
jgi:acetylornithine deacetylase/succinyl-diaminopimelate desuccinylase-like protein